MTGGGAMVKAAYSSGTPALGVGVGNAVTGVRMMSQSSKKAPKQIRSWQDDPGSPDSGVQPVQSRGRLAGAADQTFVPEFAHDLFAQAFNVEGMTGDEMPQPFDALRQNLRHNDAPE